MPLDTLPPELLDELLIGHDDVLTRWSGALDVSKDALTDRIATELAFAFSDGGTSYEDADSLANALFGAWVTTEDRPMPTLAWSVFLAFDDGEYTRPGREPEDTVATYTIPALRGILEGLRPAGR